MRSVPLGLCCFLTLVAPTRALAAQSIFLAIPGLNGGSADTQFSGAFEATAVTSGVVSTDAATGGSGAGAGKATFAPVVVKLRGTTAGSATLEQAAATGQRFPQAVVSVRRAGESPFVFLTYTLTDVAVTAFQRDAGAAEDTPTESVSLSYATIKTDVQQQNADGSPGPVVSSCWDVRANARCP